MITDEEVKKYVEMISEIEDGQDKLSGWELTFVDKISNLLAKPDDEDSFISKRMREKLEGIHQKATA